MKAECKLDVFISYNRRDAAAADGLRARLQEAGIESFIDHQQLPLGQSWQPRLEAAINTQTTATLVLLGPSGLGSWQQDEIALALERQHR